MLSTITYTLISFYEFFKIPINLYEFKSMQKEHLIAYIEYN